jgi:glycosyltransferase involved in cell wall biosynthesis
MADTHRIVIVTPVFDDWEALALLLRAVDKALSTVQVQAHVLVVDDGSFTDMPASLGNGLSVAIESVDVLHLRRNLGHQRAIAVGLVYIHEHLPGQPVLIMDSDGEDRPEDLPRLIAAFRESPEQIVFAARRKRLESFVFRVFYLLYCLLHLMLTGIRVEVGNFSIVPASALERLAVASELWSHYAAAVFRARIPFRTIPADRGRRLAGRSKMRFAALVAHGLSAISVFGDVVSVRLLVSAALFIAAAFGLIVTGAVLRFTGTFRLPDGALWLMTALAVVCTQAVIMAFVMAFVVHHARANATFIPERDAPAFVKLRERIYPRELYLYRRKAGAL